MITNYLFFLRNFPYITSFQEFLYYSFENIENESLGIFGGNYYSISFPIFLYLSDNPYYCLNCIEFYYNDSNLSFNIYENGFQSSSLQILLLSYGNISYYSTQNVNCNIYYQMHSFSNLNNLTIYSCSLSFSYNFGNTGYFVAYPVERVIYVDYVNTMLQIYNGNELIYSPSSFSGIYSWIYFQSYNNTIERTFLGTI